MAETITARTATDADLRGDDASSAGAAAERAADRTLEATSRLSEAAQRDAAALRHASTTPQTLALICQTAETLLLAAAIWAVAPPTQGGAPGVLTALAALAAALAVTSLGRAFGAYRVASLRRFLRGYPRLALAVAATGLGVSLAAALSGAAAPNLTPASMTALVAALAARVLIAPTIDWCVSAGLTERRVVLVGGGGNADRLIRSLEQQADSDIRIVGIFDDRDDQRSPPMVAGARKLGGVAELIEFCRIAHIDMAIVTLPLSARRRIELLLEQLWVLPIDIRLSSYADGVAFRRRARAVGSGEMIEVARRPFHGVGGLLKRAMDIAVALGALVALSPVLLATAAAVRLTSPGPVFFRQRRHGYNDQVVEVLKFRSMYADQEDRTARRVVSKDDPRVTPVGRFIRKTSIDELPQLFNVLSGEMSLVGPRPHVVDAVTSEAQEFASIVSGYSARHRVKPGITGLAQINGCRGEITDPDKLRRRFEYDLEYIENWSLWGDVMILLRTPGSLLNTENAY